MTAQDTMSAAVLTAFGGSEVLVVRHDVPTPQPQTGQVRVRVSAAALNNTDVWTREGAYGTAEDPVREPAGSARSRSHASRARTSSVSSTPSART